MALFGLLGFLSLCVTNAYKFNKKFVTVLPVCVAVWICLLYFLAFFQKLDWIDFIGAGWILFMILFLISRKDEVWKKRKLILCNSTFAVVIVYLLLYFINKNRMAWHGDELAVWAIEVKSLFYVNGFAEKYKNVALAYGDYYPGQMLFEWWICHFDAMKFNEGLMYVGYHFLYASFLVPVLKIIDEKKNKVMIILYGIVFFIMILVLPSTVESTSYMFLSVELLISVIYGNLLYNALEKDENKKFYYFKITMYLMLMMLLKNVSIIYVILFWILFFIFRKGQDGDIKYVDKNAFVIITILPCIPILLWKFYCKIFERSNYFQATYTTLLKDIFNRTFQFSSDTKLFIKSFFKSLFVEPLHANQTLLLDVSAFLCVILTICLLVFAFKKSSYFVKRCIIIHYLLSVFVLLAALLFMHVFIFRESHYIYTNNMIFSVSRYTEPIFLGTIVFAFFIIINECNNYKRKKVDLLAILLPVIFCSNYGVIYNHIINYTPIRESVVAEATEVSNKNRDILRQISDHQINGRILYVVNNDNYLEPSEQGRFKYIIAPASMVYQFVDISKVEIDQNYSDILWQINKNNCQYVFFKDISEAYLNSFQFYNVEEKNGVLLKIEKDMNGEIYFKSLD